MTPRNPVFFAIFSIAVGCSSAVGEGNFEKQGPTNEGPTGEDPIGEEPIDSDAGVTPGSDAATPATDSGSSTPEPTEPSGDPPVAGLPLVANLAISEVAVFQGVKVPVAKSGAKVTTRAADVIAGREALVRVYVAPRAGWTPREVVAELKLVSASGEKTFSASLTPNAASADATPASTFNIFVPTDAIAVDSKYSVSLYAKSGAVTGDTSGARYPSSGTSESLDAKSTGETLKIKIVPIQYNADGTGRLPDVSAAQIERYRTAFYAMYPAKKVEVTVRAPYVWSSTIDRGGSGFSSVLQAMIKLRQSDGAPRDVYYYGAFAPKSSFSNYCSGGCVTGLCGLLNYPNDATGRACVGVGFSGDDAAQTAAHEIGHAHGRAHAPCGTGDADSKYPYSGGAIGSWGYDVVARKLYSPTAYKDFMGYCSPTWISDYTFKAIATRMSFVSSAAHLITTAASPTAYRFVDVAGDGRLSWGDSITLAEPPLAEPHTVRYVDDQGHELERATGFYYPYNDLPGGYMLVPEGPRAASAIAVTGFTPVETRLPKLF